MWEWAKGKLGRDDLPLWGRKVCNAGPAMAGLADDGQMDFWRESASEAEKCLQYCLRDVLQGVEKWIAHVHDGAEVEEFAGGVEGAKMHRLLGVWRHAAIKADEAAEAGEGESPASTKTSAPSGEAKPVFEVIGTMDGMLWKAKHGVTACADLIREFVSMTSNRSCVNQRLLRAVAFLAG
jgi:hypothetical protein